MIYTYGSTGRPKGVWRDALEGEALRRFRAGSTSGYGLDYDESATGRRFVVLMNGPMYHSAPNAYGFNALRLGAEVVLQPRFDAEELLALIERHRVTHMHIVPVMMNRLLRLPEAVRIRYDLSSLVDVVHGAAPCPVETKRRMIEWWGPVVSEYYGSTEAGLLTRITAVEALRKPGSVGRALPDTRIAIVGPDGDELPAGRIGMIYARAGHAPAFTYHGDPAKRQAAARGELATVGDLGWIDPDGYLYVSGRRLDLVISGGVNIYPAEIEAALLTLPGVRDCAVFGIPDEEYGEAVCAWIEPDPAAALTAEGLRAGLRPLIAGFKIPRVIEFSARLPREDSGKIFKQTLRAPYWAGRESGPAAPEGE